MSQVMEDYYRGQTEGHKTQVEFLMKRIARYEKALRWFRLFSKTKFARQKAEEALKEETET